MLIIEVFFFFWGGGGAELESIICSFVDTVGACVIPCVFYMV